MSLSAQDFARFKSLVEDNSRHTEKECAEFLYAAAGLLLPGTPLASEATSEIRNYFGSTDFVLVATLPHGVHQPYRAAFIWELKSPQTYLLEPDDNRNRFRPTPEFLKAENQLLHYSHEAIANDAFRVRANVLERHNIKMGGIIIGRKKDRLFKGTINSENVTNANTALALRERYLYNEQGIQVFAWDTILDFVAPTN